MLERILSHVRIENIELFGKLLADSLRCSQKLVEMAPTRCRHDSFHSEEKDELLELGLVFGKGLDVESLERVLVGCLGIEPRLTHRRDDYPIARQVDGVSVSLVNGRHLAADKRPVKRVFRPLAF